MTISNLPCLVLLLVMIPAMAQGVEGKGSGGDFSFLSSFFQMLAALALVIGLILLTYYILTRLVRKMPALRPGHQYIRVLEVRAMGPRKTLVLVEVGGEYLLLSNSGDQLGLIKKINMIEEIEVVAESAEVTSFLSYLKHALVKN